MSRFKSKQELVDDIVKEYGKLDDLLRAIPNAQKTVEVSDGMSVKDFLAHRTEWGRMFKRWYSEAKAGKAPAVPTAKYKWNQLKPLNAEIFERFKDTPLKKIEADFRRVHHNLLRLVERMSEAELMEKQYYGFTGRSDLATYANSATAAHYRSARRHIKRWWKQRAKD